MCDIQNCNLNICLPPPSLILQAGVTDGAITGHFGEQMEISWFIEKLFTFSVIKNSSSLFKSDHFGACMTAS